MNSLTVTSRKERFLSQFNTGLLPHIFEFAKSLTSTKSDVTMLMARKAACFIDCLEELGLVALNGFITTDRILDMDTSWLRGKRVLVVDEALISGTTLNRAKTKLLRSGVKDVDIRVLCVNRETYSKDLVQINTPCLFLDDQQTTSLCADIVEAISLLPLPYAVDFPHFRNLRILSRDLDEVTNLLNWEAHDVTSSLQKDHNILSLTLIPTKPVSDKFHQSLGWKPQEGSHIFKIRLYGHLVDSKRKLYLFNVMPIAVFDPFSLKQINIIWSNLLDSYGDKESLSQNFKSARSRIRLLQYAVSARLGRYFIDSVNQSLNTKVQTQHDLRMMGYLFPPANNSFVINVCQSDKPLFVKNLNIESENIYAASSRDYSVKEPNVLKVQAGLTKPFMDFYNEKEVIARDLALKYGRLVFEMPEYKEIMDRLKTGISLPELRAILKSQSKEFDVAKTVSLFIDFAVDRGIIVPIIAERKGVFFRAYRHGEDIKFTESEIRLFCLAVRNFLTSSQREMIPHLTTEKLFVLLIRIGLHKKFLTRWIGTLGENGTVGIRYALKGAVVQANSRKIYEYTTESSLTSIMLDSGCLGEYTTEQKVDGKKKETGYVIKYIPSAPVKEGAELEAELIGSLFAKLCYPDKSEDINSRLSQPELTLIATCLHSNDVAGALAAEMDIFVQFWRRVRKIISQGLDENIQTEELQEAVSDLRDPKTRFFEAINSGWWKFVSFMHGVPSQIIQRITDELDNPIYKNIWRGFWSSTNQESAFPTELKSLVNRQGSWCIRANIFIRLIEIALLQKQSRLQNTQEDSKRLLEDREEIKTLMNDLRFYDNFWSKRITQDLIKLEESIAGSNSKSVENILRYSNTQLLSLIGEATAILDLVDVVAEPFGKPAKFSRYSHAIYINVKQFVGSGRVREKIYKIVNSYRIRAKKQSKNMTKLGVIPFGQKGSIEGLWVCATGKLGRVWLIKLAEELLNEIYNITDLKILLITNLQDDWHLLRSDTNSDFKGRHFWKLAQTLIESSSFVGENSGFFYAIPSSNKDEKNLEDELFNNIPDLYQAKTSKIIINEPNYLSVTLKQFSFVKREELMQVRKADIGIITIVLEETKAVKDYLEKNQNYKKTKGKKSKGIYYEGVVPKFDGSSYKVVCTQQLEQGNRSVMSAYQRLIQDYNPILIVLLGIGGGIHPDAKLGDVVLAEQIFYYDERKETEIDTKRKAEAYRIPALLKPYINDFFVELGSNELQTNNLFPRSTFTLHFGPLGSGEAVIKYREAEVRNWLLNVNEKTLVLETEAGGFAQSFYEDELSRDEKAVGYLIIRGISDHADEDKDDKWRTVASENAVLSLTKLLESISRFADDDIFPK